VDRSILNPRFGWLRQQVEDAKGYCFSKQVKRQMKAEEVQVQHSQGFVPVIKQPIRGVFTRYFTIAKLRKSALEIAEVAPNTHPAFPWIDILLMGSGVQRCSAPLNSVNAPFNTVNDHGSWCAEV